MQTFTQQLLGGIPPASFFTALFFAAVGVVFSLLLEAVNRDPNSGQSPIPFTLSYLLSDNFHRLYTSFALNTLAILICIRFAPDIIGQQLSPVVALGIGIGFDKIAQTIKNKFKKT